MRGTGGTQWVKGKQFSIAALLGDEEQAKLFNNGSLSIHRLAPQARAPSPWRHARGWCRALGGFEFSVFEVFDFGFRVAVSGFGLRVPGFS